jgi:hypothetical protein
VKRREFIKLLGSSVAGWPPVARADQTGMPVIGIVGLGPNPEFVEGFRQGLAEASYVPGQYVAMSSVGPIIHFRCRGSLPNWSTARWT